MARPLVTALPLTVALTLGSAVLGGVHFYALDQGSPGGLLAAYQGAAASGDLSAIDALAPPGKVDEETEALGGAWHARVEQALRHAAIAGALDAYQAHLRYEEAKTAARSAYYDLPWRDRPDGRDRWIHDRAVETLSADDQALAYVDEDGDGRTYWNDVATAGYGEWRALRYQAQREHLAAGTQPQFLAEQGAWDLSLAQRKALVQLGMDALQDSDRLVLEHADFDAWAEGGDFVQARGATLLAGLYRESYAAGGFDTRTVERAQPEGLLYRPGVAFVTAGGPGLDLQGTAVRPGGDWRFAVLEDLDLDGAVAQLRADDGAQAFTRLSASGGAL